MSLIVYCSQKQTHEKFYWDNIIKYWLILNWLFSSTITENYFFDLWVIKMYRHISAIYIFLTPLLNWWLSKVVIRIHMLSYQSSVWFHLALSYNCAYCLPTVGKWHRHHCCGAESSGILMKMFSLSLRLALS